MACEIVEERNAVLSSSSVQKIFYSPLEFVTSFQDIRGQRSVVQCHGVFDLLHIGHIKHFQVAKSFGDCLVVTLTPDRFVNKGAGRPKFPEQLRAEAIASLACVDYVVINQSPTAVEPISCIKPTVYVKGGECRKASLDLTGKIQEEIAAVESVGGRIEFTDEATFSYSSLINEYYPGFPPDVVAYLSAIKQKYTSDQILSYLDHATALKVLVIGETIIDEYCYCETMAKSGEEPVMDVKYLYKERYIGGVLAIANHMASFCDQVDCVTLLGEKGEGEAFIRTQLKPNITLKPYYKESSPTLVKRRYVDHYLKQKLFEVCEMNDDPLKLLLKSQLTADLQSMLPDYDVVIVADYGHALIDTEVAQMLCNNASFLAVNTQANAGNQGFNLITKFPQANFISIARREMNLAITEKNSDVTSGIKKLASFGQYDTQLITCGKDGSVAACLKTGEISQAPSLASVVVDRVGAGDAVLAIASLYAALSAPLEVVNFIANVVGAEAVTIMGRERFIEKTPLMKHISHLLK